MTPVYEWRVQTTIYLIFDEESYKKAASWSESKRQLFYFVVTAPRRL